MFFLCAQENCARHHALWVLWRIPKWLRQKCQPQGLLFRPWRDKLLTIHIQSGTSHGATRVARRDWEGKLPPNIKNSLSFLCRTELILWVPILVRNPPPPHTHTRFCSYFSLVWEPGRKEKFSGETWLRESRLDDWGGFSTWGLGQAPCGIWPDMSLEKPCKCRISTKISWKNTSKLKGWTH